MSDLEAARSPVEALTAVRGLLADHDAMTRAIALRIASDALVSPAWLAVWTDRIYRGFVLEVTGLGARGSGRNG